MANPGQMSSLARLSSNSSSDNGLNAMERVPALRRSRGKTKLPNKFSARRAFWTFWQWFNCCAGGLFSF